MGKKISNATKEFFVGFDIGSSWLHYVVLNVAQQVVYAPTPIMHFADPHGALKEAWGDVLSRYDRGDIRSTAFSGGGAKAFSVVMSEICYVYESVAIPKGIETVAPKAAYIFHIGAKDAYFFHVRNVNHKAVIQEWATGTKCGGGSGTLIEKQCRRLFQGEVPHPELGDTGCTTDARQREQICSANRHKIQYRLEHMLHLAEEEARLSTEPSEFLARCGVVVQSDLIHKQNEGTLRRDNLAGLFQTVARNYKIDVLGARQFPGSNEPMFALATGGVMANDLIKDHLAALLGLRVDRAPHFNNIAAIGAAAQAIVQDNRFVFSLDLLDKATSHSRQNRQFALPLSTAQARVHNHQEALAHDIPEGIEVAIGIDGGSTTTKGALVDCRSGRLLDKLYIKTHGDPESSLKKVIAYLSRHREKVVVRGVGATGSARKLYEKILLSKTRQEKLAANGKASTDCITDEITCHALGVKHNNPQTDTIFEIGGQDMKFTRFAEDGSVKEAKMNYSCQAGSGQTLENMADIINLDVENTLQEAALRAERIPIIDATCGVFMEMDENRLIAEGFSRDEIAAAIVRGTAASYYYKFVGGAQHVGQTCSAQGGPPLGAAFLAALAQVSDRDIEGFPHREMFGAWGQALDVINHIKDLESAGTLHDTAFRGWGLVDMPLDKKRLSCHDLLSTRSCGMRDCQLEVFRIESDEIITGGFCPQGNSEGSVKLKTNYVDRYYSLFNKHFHKQGLLIEELDEVSPQAPTEGPTIGIKRSTATLGEKGIWAATMLRVLGFRPVISPRSTSTISQLGIDTSRTEFCIARKLATGHAQVLHDHPQIEYLFNPSFIEQRMPTPPDLKYCIYTESEGYILNDVLSLDKNKQVNPILHFQDVPLLMRELQIEFDRLGLHFSRRQIKKAITQADQAERDFQADLYAEGDRFLERIERNNQKAYIGLGRDYVLLDPEASAQSGAMFSQVRGLDYLPQVFLEHRFQDISLDGIVENEFWVQSVKILKAGLWVAEHPLLYGIRLINFGCGPDSLKIYQERKIQQTANKPLLVLVTDGQTSNAPFVTRTEAHERVVEQTPVQPFNRRQLLATPPQNQKNRTWLVPFMGPASHMASAAFRSLGVDSQVLPTNTHRSREMARKHIHTEVCHPLKGVVGDALGFLRDEIDRTSESYVKNRYLVMLPTTSGPCRFGKYTELTREFMAQEGLQDVPVMGPTSKTDYTDLPFPKHVGVADKVHFQKILFRGIRAVDLLEDICLRFRPYACNKQAMNALKAERLAVLEKVIEAGGAVSDIVDWGHQTVAAFQAQPLRDVERYPLVLYIGEIYMRQHDPYTDNVVDKLEAVGLELVRDPVTDWMHYINRMTQRNAQRDMQLGWRHGNLRQALREAAKFSRSQLKGWYMAQVEKQIDDPFHNVLAGRHTLPKPMDIIETLEKAHEIHGNIEGESPLSTGIAYHVMHDLTANPSDVKVCGVFHLGPFTCMQESVATAKIEAMVKELRKKKPDLVFPIIHAFFGDSPNVNLEAEIAVFREQCYQKRDLLRGPHKRVAVDIDIQALKPKSGQRPSPAAERRGLQRGETLR
ncbi:acyl-CoA dehydratase activase-related protein [Planctomycetota bacterium]